MGRHIGSKRKLEETVFKPLQYLTGSHDPLSSQTDEEQKLNILFRGPVPASASGDVFWRIHYLVLQTGQLTATLFHNLETILFYGARPLYLQIPWQTLDLRGNNRVMLLLHSVFSPEQNDPGYDVFHKAFTLL
jgi:hypothetical protein